MPAAFASERSRSENPLLTKADLAALSHAEIAELSVEEMIEIIAAADLPFARGRRLVFQSTETLRQLTHLACQCCRNQGY